MDKGIIGHNLLDDIDLLESKYSSLPNSIITNVSDWNPSGEFKKSLSCNIKLNYDIDSIDYIFSYTHSNEQVLSVLDQLGFSSKKSILFTHSSSASIFNCVNMLHSIGIKKLIVICPAYFTLFYACSIYGIDCVPVYLERSTDSYSINSALLLDFRDENTAFWVTNPVYCTSLYYEKNIIDLFSNLLINNIVVFDESLCISSKELSCQLGFHENFIGIYSPHKSICMNACKFSVLVSNIEHQDFLDTWSDAICGCLNSSNEIAISHFLSDNFKKYRISFMDMILYNKKIVESICDDIGVSYDKSSYGYLITVYFPNIDSNKGTDLLFLEKIMQETGIRFIPGKINHFSDNVGFCFRINLAAYNLQFHFALERAFMFLSRINHKCT